MTSLLSAISGQFAKMMVLGTLFPVVIISILNVVFVGPLLPSASGLQAQLKRVAIGEDKWAVVTLTFIVIVLTGMLYNLNIPIIRLYEGYPWKKSYVGTLLARREERRFTRARSLRLALMALARELRNKDPNDIRATALGVQQTALAQYLNSELPDQKDFILPTRFGNVIRCFERYSSLAYGMDAIVLWPRLVAKIDPRFAGTIDEAKISLDFVLNCSFLSAVTGLGIIAVELASPEPLTWTSAVSWLWRATIFLALAVIFYRYSIGRARAWGLQVKAAFDLYRLDLLLALGYQQKPSSLTEEKSLWQRISAQLEYADSKAAPLPYRDAPSRVIVTPVGLQLKVTRRFNASGPDGSIPVEVIVENSDAARRTADALRLVESLPEGYTYVFYSARASSGRMEVLGLKPLELVCGPIGLGAKLTVTYAIKKIGV